MLRESRFLIVWILKKIMHGWFMQISKISQQYHIFIEIKNHKQTKISIYRNINLLCIDTTRTRRTFQRINQLSHLHFSSDVNIEHHRRPSADSSTGLDSSARLIGSCIRQEVKSQRSSFAENDIIIVIVGRRH